MLLNDFFGWWVLTGSNRRHPACKASALPTELSTHTVREAERGLVYRILKAFTSAELWNLSSLDLYRGTCLRITAATSGTFANIERPEPYQGDHAALLQGRLHSSNCCVECTPGSRFGQIG